MKTVIIHTDGGCHGNPGPGGWAASLRYKERSREIGGGVPATTNNRMELTAAIEALSALKEKCTVELYTDSKYVMNGITEWLPGWKANGWRTGKNGKKPLKNEELWRTLDALCQTHAVEWKWVKGHADNRHNNRCDELVQHEIHKITVLMKTVIIHTDGGCHGNPGPGGWAASLRYKERSREIGGGVPATTNNRMELTAAIEALSALKEKCTVELYTDSKYVMNGITEWLPGWKTNGWRTGKNGKKPLKNEDLWRTLDALCRTHAVEWKWVKGHADNRHNNRCDALVQEEIRKIKKAFRPAQLEAALHELKIATEGALRKGELFGT